MSGVGKTSVLTISVFIYVSSLGYSGYVVTTLLGLVTIGVLDCIGVLSFTLYLLRNVYSES